MFKYYGGMVFKFIVFLLLACYTLGDIKFNHEYAKLTGGKSVCDNLLKITYFDFHKFNRTTKALSLNFTLYKDITFKNDIEIKSAFFMWKNNDYKKTPITWSMRTCSFLEKNGFAIQSLLSDSSTQKCPIKKGENYIRNISPPNLDGWPSIIPEGKWKLVIEYYFENTLCISVEWVTKIVKN